MNIKNKKQYFLVLLSVFIALLSLLGVKTAVAGPYTGTHTNWLFRHMPYQIYWGEVMPGAGAATWGGPDHETLYVTTGNGCISPGECTLPEGMYKSNDYGLSWEHMTPMVEGGGYLSKELILLVTHPISGNIMLATVFSGYNNGLYRSEDYGASWRIVAGTIVYDVEFDLDQPNVIYLSSTSGVLRSSNYGITWGEISSLWFHDLALTPGDSGVMYAAREFSTGPEEGIYRSNDGGVTWNQTSYVGGVQRVLVDPGQTDRVYAFGADGCGISRTDDGGVNWVNVDNNLPPLISTPTIQSMFYDPGNERLRIGLKYGGMWYSDNHGESWQEWNPGLVTYGGGIYGPQCTYTGISPMGNYFAICSGLIHFSLIQPKMFFPFVVGSEYN